MNPAQSPARSGEPVSAILDALLRPWNRSDAPGLVIGVAREGRTLYRRGFGLASVEHGTANSPTTRMRIGSTSKHFAALAAVLLAEDGRLDLDAPVRTYLPELSGVSGTPTLRQLMQHTSGLRDPYDLPAFLQYGHWSTLICAGTGLENARRFTTVNFPPGERMIYANQGYYLLSLAIERASGQSFAAFLKERILAPLGMVDTELVPSDMTLLPRLATLHVPEAGGGYRRGIYPTEELLGSGGMVSTIDDMLAWLAHLRAPEKRIGTGPGWQQMLQRPVYSSGATGDYCLGLIRETYRGVETIHHAGAIAGGTCQMLTVPGHALDIILMFNRMDGPASSIALKVVDALLGEHLAPAPTPVVPAGREEVMGHWYASGPGRLYSVAAHASPGQPPVLALSVQGIVMGVLREADGALVATSPAHGTVELRLPPAGGKRPEALEIADSGHPEHCVRLPEAPPSAASLAAEVAGDYRWADLDLVLSVRLDGDALVLDLHPISGTSRFRLTPISDSVCTAALDTSWPQWLPAPHLGALVTFGREGGAVRGLWLNNSRTRNLWLERCP